MDLGNTLKGVAELPNQGMFGGVSRLMVVVRLAPATGQTPVLEGVNAVRHVIEWLWACSNSLNCFDVNT